MLQIIVGVLYGMLYSLLVAILEAHTADLHEHAH